MRLLLYSRSIPATPLNKDLNTLRFGEQRRGTKRRQKTQHTEIPSKLCRELRQHDDSGVNLYPQFTIQQSEAAVIDPPPEEELVVLPGRQSTAKKSGDSTNETPPQPSIKEEGVLEYLNVDDCGTTTITVHPTFETSVQSQVEDVEYNACNVSCECEFVLPIYSPGQQMLFTSSNGNKPTRVSRFAMSLSAIASDRNQEEPILEYSINAGQGPIAAHIHHVWPKPGLDSEVRSPSKLTFTNIRLRTGAHYEFRRASYLLVVELLAYVGKEGEVTGATVKVASQEFARKVLLEEIPVVKMEGGRSM